MKKLIWLLFLLPYIAAANDPLTFAYCATHLENNDCVHVNNAKNRLADLELRIKALKLEQSISQKAIIQSKVDNSSAVSPVPENIIEFEPSYRSDTGICKVFANFNPGSNSTIIAILPFALSEENCREILMPPLLEELGYKLLVPDFPL